MGRRKVWSHLGKAAAKSSPEMMQARSGPEPRREREESGGVLNKIIPLAVMKLLAQAEFRMKV
jgi:hypothetical protein